MGLIDYYRNCFKDYGKIASPLISLLKRDVFTWTHVVECAFDKVKQGMCTKLLLGMPNFSNPFTIESDACKNGLGVILLQDEHPNVFTIKYLHSNNLATSTNENEMLAIFHVVQKCYPYL